MMKTILSILTLFAAVPAIAHAEEPATQRFEHKGSSYSYTVTQIGDIRVIRGVEERTGKPFTLRVGARRVHGAVGSQQVSFPLRDVEPLAKSATNLASR
jgi:hypothetical protein